MEATSQVAYAAHVAHQEMLHMADNNKTYKKKQTGQFVKS